jgi:regulator of PEP synthase PpsR (kinase-PPPase family)
MARFHLHLVSDSTGETLESVAKAALAQFEEADAIKHFWPMVRSVAAMDRVLDEIGRRPGLVLHTIVLADLRARLEDRCRALGVPAVAPLDAVVGTLGRLLGQSALNLPGRQHMLDQAYFARVAAIDYTMAHDDGHGAEDWEEADIVLAGVSRTSKTPTSIYLANRGYKTANVPIVPRLPPPPMLFELRKPLVVGLTTSAERLVSVRRNRLLSVGQAPETDYVDPQAVQAELLHARRLFADRGWPVVDVTRRSIEETAAAVINLLQERREAAEGSGAK